MNDPIRLVIKNIPGFITDKQFFEILQKNLYKIVHEPTLVNASYQPDAKSKAKICLVTVFDPESRLKVYEFFVDFELIDQKGLKHKLTIVDCLNQRFSKQKSEDVLNGTIMNSISIFTNF